ncbi:hypothetical protein PZB74_17910 [Porifericola rhodea]|uniref:hypothetical protein n=1 Tax=Porifericola rhodea TaxID=930972 RepID=UPI002666A6C2|nr:hypothetical protein [Porifericola rhodea]WKN30834.1 hypothetical protein PZB74_17910 [Porifericola rhodea]
MQTSVRSDQQKKFENYLDNSIQERRYIKLQYFTDIHEFMTISTIALSINEDATKHEKMVNFNTGEQIPLSQIVRIDDVYAAKYVHIDDFSCDC